MINGTYKSQPESSFEKLLILRVDLAQDGDAAGVECHAVSGDVFSHTTHDGGTASFGQLHYSWRVDEPVVIEQSGETVISGAVVSDAAAGDAPNSISVRIRGSQGVVAFNNDHGVVCIKTGPHFRKVKLYMQRAGALSNPPVHDIPPAHPTLDLQGAYLKSGIDLEVVVEETDAAAHNPTHPDRWTVAGLHHLLNSKFQADSASLFDPEVSGMWGFLVGTFVPPSSSDPNYRAAGVMFDTGHDKYGAGNNEISRQGFAIFQNAFMFTDEDLTDQQKIRNFFFTWMHESGHTFNMPHTFDHGWHGKDRDDHATWMAYPDRFPPGTFWNRFNDEFDKNERHHLRHGYWNQVAIGGDGDYWGGNDSTSNQLHLFSDFTQLAEKRPTYGQPPLEVLVRSQNFFEHMEPVAIELRLRNLQRRCAYEVPTNLDGSEHDLVLLIKSPCGKLRRYRPVYHLLADCSTTLLNQPYLNGLLPGGDRRSYLIDLTFGSGGFYFEEPGNYEIRAAYHGESGSLITSTIHKLRIGIPISKERDRLAGDYFRQETGYVHALHGSRSPMLSKGWDVLEELSNRFSKYAIGAKANAVLANGLCQEFCDIHAADGKNALAKTKHALKFVEKQLAKDPYGSALNYRNLMQFQITQHIARGEISAAQNTITRLKRNLEQVQVKQTVLDAVCSWECTLNLPNHSQNGKQSSGNRRHAKTPN